jgi:hypothetical protein
MRTEHLARLRIARLLSHVAEIVVLPSESSPLCVKWVLSRTNNLEPLTAHDHHDGSSTLTDPAYCALLPNPVTPRGEPAGAAALDLYKSVPNATVRTLDAGDDPVQVLANWASGP